MTTTGLNALRPKLLSSASFQGAPAEGDHADDARQHPEDVDLVTAGATDDSDQLSLPPLKRPRPPPTALPTISGFYSINTVVDLTTLSAVTIWRRIRDGEFPRSVKLSKGRVGFPRAAVDAWIAEKSAASASEEAGNASAA